MVEHFRKLAFKALFWAKNQPSNPKEFGDITILAIPKIKRFMVSITVSFFAVFSVYSHHFYDKYLCISLPHHPFHGHFSPHPHFCTCPIQLWCRKYLINHCQLSCTSFSPGILLGLHSPHLVALTAAEFANSHTLTTSLLAIFVPLQPAFLHRLLSPLNTAIVTKGGKYLCLRLTMKNCDLMRNLENAIIPTEPNHEFESLCMSWVMHVLGRHYGKSPNWFSDHLFPA